MDNAVLNQNVDSLFKSLEDFTQKEGIIGKPVIQGDKTFLPVISITVGYGSGNASIKGGNSALMSGSQNTGTGAQGLGAKLCTDAVILIDGQNNHSVSLLPVNSSASNLMDKIPQIVSGMSQSKQAQGQSQSSSQSASQSQSQNKSPTSTASSTTSY